MTWCFPDLSRSFQIFPDGWALHLPISSHRSLSRALEWPTALHSNRLSSESELTPREVAIHLSLSYWGTYAVHHWQCSWCREDDALRTWMTDHDMLNLFIHSLLDAFQFIRGKQDQTTPAVFPGYVPILVDSLHSVWALPQPSQHTLLGRASLLRRSFQSSWTSLKQRLRIGTGFSCSIKGTFSKPLEYWWYWWNIVYIATLRCHSSIHQVRIFDGAWPGSVACWKRGEQNTRVLGLSQCRPTHYDTQIKTWIWNVFVWNIK